MNNSILNLIVFLGAAQGFILSSILLIKKEGNRKANIILSLLIFFISLEIFHKYLNMSGLISEFSYFILISEPFYLILGPLIYLYTKFQISPELSFKKRHLLFIMPLLLELTFYVKFYTKSTVDKLSKIAELSLDSNYIEDYCFVWSIEAVYNIFFILLAIRLLYFFNKKIKNNFSNIEKINFKWLRTFLTISISFFSIQLFLAIFIGSIDTIEDTIALIYLLIGLIFLTVGYRGLFQSLVPVVVENGKSEKTVIKDKNSDKAAPEKYSKSTLTDEFKMEIIGKLQKIMVEEKKYLETNLKLKNLAEEIDISTNNLSQIINEKLNKNFYDFVNSYRIDFAKELLLDPKKKHLTILAISYDVGFNSKSTFNRVFKEITSMTPTKFREGNR